MELEQALTSIADSLREERNRAGLTLEQLAQRAELSPAHLSRLESGDRQPSIAALIALSRALGVPMSTLLGERRGEPAIGTYEPHAPARVANGLAIAPVSGFAGSATLQALHITISPDREPPEPARHRGEEWIYVVSGTLQLEFDGVARVLEQGSTAHFDANRPHRLAALSGPTEVLVVAADTLNDFRPHPLFSAYITDH